MHPVGWQIIHMQYACGILSSRILFFFVLQPCHRCTWECLLGESWLGIWDKNGYACSCPIFFRRIPSDMSSLLQRILHCVGYALGSRLKAFTMQLPTRLFKNMRSTACPVMFRSRCCFFFFLIGKKNYVLPSLIRDEILRLRDHLESWRTWALYISSLILRQLTSSLLKQQKINKYST